MPISLNTFAGKGSTLTKPEVDSNWNTLQSSINTMQGQIAALEAGGGGGDTTPPVVISANVFNSTPNIVVIKFSEPLNAAVLSAISAFTISGKTITARAIVGDELRITANSPYSYGVSITAGYTQPGSNKLQDAAGNLVASFSGLVVTNNISAPGDTTPPTILSATVFNTAKDTIVYKASEPLNASIVSALSAFAMSGKTVTAVSVVADEIRVTGNSVYNYGDVINGGYTQPLTDKIQDLAGNFLASFTGMAVTNSIAAPGDTTAPTIVYAVVHDSAKNVVIFKASEPLNASIIPALSALTLTGKTVISLAVVSDEIHATVNSDYSYTDVSITGVYTQPATNKFQDTAGNFLASFSRSVTNDIAVPAVMLSSGRFLHYDFLGGSGQKLFNLDGGNTADTNLLPIGTRRPDGLSYFDANGVYLGNGETVTPEYANDEDGNPVATRVQLGAGGNNTGAAAGTGTWPSYGIQQYLPAGTYTLSLRAKSTSGSSQQMRIGAVVNTFGTDVTVAGSWTTLSYTFTLGSAGTIRIYFAANGTGEAATDVLISKMKLEPGSSATAYVAPAYDGVFGDSGVSGEASDPAWISGKGIDFTGQKKIKAYVNDMETGLTAFSLHMVLKLNLGATQQGWLWASGTYPYDTSFKAGNKALTTHQPRFTFSPYVTVSASTAGLADGEPHLVTCTYDGNNARMYIDSLFVGMSSSPSPETANIKEILLGGIEAVSSNTSFDGTVYDISAYTVCHDQTQITQQYNYYKGMMSGRGETMKRIAKLMIWEGDSLSTEPNINFARKSIGTQLVPVQGRSFAQIGAQVGEDEFTVSTNTLFYRAPQVDALFDPTRERNILNVFIGANDLTAITAATFVPRLKSYCLQRKAVGWEILLCTLLPNTAMSLTERALANAAIKADGTFWDALCTWDEETYGEDGAELNTAWYHDGVHTTEALQLLMGATHAVTLDGLLGGS